MIPDFIPSSSILEVDLRTIANNFQAMKSFAAPSCLALAVVKANGYGHGAVEIAQHIEHQADWFATASVGEAVELREAGITKPILILSAARPNLSSYYKTYDLTAVVSDLSHFDFLENGTKAHLQFDTGMFRFGILPHLINEVKQKVSQSKLEFSGVMTHFAKSGDPNDTSVAQQLEVFNELRAHFPSDWIAHTANSGGIAFYPETHLDMIRIGVSLYGYPAGSTTIPGIEPACSWRAEIIQSKPVKKGQGIGYNWTFTAPEDGFVHVVPIGYADGFTRELGNKTVVKVENEWIPVVGRITMDYCLLFASRDLKVGTEVEVLGKGLNSAYHWAEKSNTIPYEILTRIAERRVKRVYLK